ncbi:MAG TPA: hypothetical protein VIL64_00320 [Solirubrobacteraceae bacterium]|jgi:hypothetical protein
MNASATIVPGQQHLRALQRANEVRLARANLKRRIATGEMTAAEVILDSRWEAESMAVADLLMSQQRWGRTRCRKFLAQVPMSENKTIGSMTERQRRATATLLAAAVQRCHTVSTFDEASIHAGIAVAAAA